MAYSEDLAERIADVLKRKRGVTHKKMFGGIAFLLHGNMVCGVVKEDLMVRVGKDQYEDVLKQEGAREMDFTGKPLKGFVYVDETGFKTDQALEEWIMIGFDYAKTLPKKEKK